MKIIPFLIFLLGFLPGSKAQFSFNTELAGPATEKTIQLKTTIRNTSNKAIKIPKSRSVDYIRDRIVAIGTYIIDIQIYKGDSYKSFPPSADINPTYEEPELIPIQSGQSISDTLKIESYLFSPNTGSEGRFPAGQYRIRVAFNTNG